MRRPSDPIEASFADELRQRVRRDIICFLRVEKPFYVHLSGGSNNQVALFEGMILAVVAQTEDFFVADYYGSVIEIDDDIRPDFHPDYHLELRIPRSLIKNKVKLMAESDITIPDRRVTAVILGVKSNRGPTGAKHLK